MALNPAGRPEADGVAPRLEPVEVEIIHLFVQFSRAPGHPCKIYNTLAVGAPVLYIGPQPGHVTEILDAAGENDLCARVRPGEVNILIRHIRDLQQKPMDKRRQPSGTAIAPFQRKFLLPKLVAALENAGNRRNDMESQSA